MTVLHVKSPNGTVDEAMLLANNQTVTGIKTFTDRIMLGDVGQIASTITGESGEEIHQLIITASQNEDVENTNEPGAHLFLHQYYQDGELGDGGAHFVANDGTNKSGLNVLPSSINWNGNEICVAYTQNITDQGVDYLDCIRYSNGLQICNGSTQQSGTVGYVTFPLPYTVNPRIIGSVHMDTPEDLTFIVRSVDTVGFTFLVDNKNGYCSNFWAKWIALGKWK